MLFNIYHNKLFSFYPRPIMNVVPSKKINVYQLIELIKSKAYADETTELRSLKKEDRATFKKLNFDYITISGEFKTRKDSALIQHTGLIIIDIDDVENPEEIKKLLLEKCKYFLFAFTSPGGFGVKVIFQIDPDRNSQREWYEGYSNYLIELLNLPNQKIDKSGSDISRACFIGYDEQIVVNPKLKVS